MKIMISGNEITIRKAKSSDIDEIKKLFDYHKNELGFVVKSAILYSIERSELIVAATSTDDIVGIVHYRHRKDGQTTLYNIVVAPSFRRQSIAKYLVETLKQEALEKGQHLIFLKCPVDLPANEFYQANAFQCISIEKGKHRSLRTWQLSLQ